MRESVCVVVGLGVVVVVVPGAEVPVAGAEPRRAQPKASVLLPAPESPTSNRPCPPSATQPVCMGGKCFSVSKQ